MTWAAALASSTNLRRAAVRSLSALLLLFAVSNAHAKFLEPQEAFRFAAEAADASGGPMIAVRYDIADGYYLYRERFKFELDPATAHGATLGEPVFPKGEIKYDETFAKDVEYYRHQVIVRVPVIGATGPVTLLSTSQGCADAGLCYPPQVANATLTVGPAASKPGVRVAAGRRRLAPSNAR